MLILGKLKYCLHQYFSYIRNFLFDTIYCLIIQNVYKSNNDLLYPLYKSRNVMSNSEYRENYFRLKHTLSSIRKKLESKIDVGLNDIDLSKINENLSKINRINSKLSVFNKNIVRLEEYVNVLQQYSKNIYIIE